MPRVRFLQKRSLQETLDIFVDGWKVEPVTEWSPVESSLGRVLTQAVLAKTSVPHYHAAAMDGIAVRAEDTFGASEASPIRLKLASSPRTFAWVDTGQPLPPWADAVIMIEHVVPLGTEEVEIRQAAAPWQHVRLVGEDIVLSEPLLPRGHKIRPYDIGALLAAGHLQVPVARKPRVAIIPTGSELVEPGDPLPPGAIIEFNSRMTAAFLSEWGAEPTRYPPVPDDPKAIEQNLERAVEGHDIVVLIAGSSAGERDHTVETLRHAGEVLVHGIDIMPGKPAICARVKGKPVLGLPGYPVSAAIVALQVLRPLVYRFLGIAQPPVEEIIATSARKIPSKLGIEEFVRVSLGVVEKKVVALPLPRGAGAISTLVRADGFLRIPSDREGVEAGSKVRVELLRDWQEIESAILVTGSHDLTWGLIEDELRRSHPGLRLACSNVGSLAGLTALARGEAHVAGSHLLDPASGTYNLHEVDRIVGRKHVVVVRLAVREQGLIVAQGNPKNIQGIRDLVRPDVRFVNRQAGAGTRLLLDLFLAREKLSPQDIQGYEREEFSHMAVAVRVASGLADCGLGLRSAAAALGLDFIPVEREEYDLVLRRDFYRSARGQWLLDVLRSPDFRARAGELPGYDVSMAGDIKSWPPEAMGRPRSTEVQGPE
ncbi:MAG: LysR family transcriptional regulator [Candidatus Binatia bacterium]|nr:MAG: LysR family transcriptional regulator [Candidatus Binatia bacterium]